MGKIYNKLDRHCENLEIKFLIDEKLSRYTSFKIGGKADRMIFAESKEDLKGLMALIKEEGLSYFILGKGSNLLVSDMGFRGVMIKLSGDFNEITLLDEETIYCGAGVNLSNLCIFAKENSLSGLEFAYGIPGSVGGAVYMNAGAYGGEMKDVVIECQHLDEGLEFTKFETDKLDFSYRKSAYSKGGKIIVGAVIKLNKAGKEEISKTMEETLHKRVSKQPLDYPSAGSTFKRPENNFASALVDVCGLKGKSVGGAMVSEKHAGFLINYKDATCSDMLSLIELVKEEVYDKKGIELQCEVEIIGEV